MNQPRTFIETQFPVSKLSKESYKERKANHGQTLTGLGKWWGRKPLILVRAAILGLLLPASDDPQRDRETFLRVLTMDEEGLWARKTKMLSAADAYAALAGDARDEAFDVREGKPVLKRGLSAEVRLRIQKRAFMRLSYDDKLNYCARPEEVSGPNIETWAEINAHLKTEATNLSELVAELGERTFGHRPRVGDAFCGGGSIPFEAARIGCEAFGSDLSPVASTLTWAALNIVGGGPQVRTYINRALDTVFSFVQSQVDAWGMEQNERGQIATNYLYCHEAVDPHTGWSVPLSGTWVIATNPNVIARLVPDPSKKRFDIEVISGVTNAEVEEAQSEATWNKGIVCPVDTDGNWVPPTRRRATAGQWLRGKDGLRLWENDDLVPRPDDVFQERLYCVIYTDADGSHRVYQAPDRGDMEREEAILPRLRQNFAEWQAKGYIPSRHIEDGDKTQEPIRTRGYTRWHQLFNPRQLLLNGLFFEALDKLGLSGAEGVAALLMAGRVTEVNSRLCRWKVSQGGGIGGSIGTYDNQALNTLMNYATRTTASLRSIRLNYPVGEEIETRREVILTDARGEVSNCDIWITDPAYADAVNYEELSEFYLAWYEKPLHRLFPDWYTDSKRALAVRGSDESFRLAMVECYRNFAQHMPDNGLQIVMFTHTDAEVWADLALVLWAAGLRVTAAWTIATETEASGLKQGNYVQGTVLLVLRKQTGDAWGDLSDIFPEVQREVERQMESMTALDDRDDPNFSDSDYQLAAYAAALRVLTSYKEIEEINVDREIRRVRTRKEKSPLADVIEKAVKIASDYLVPRGIERTVWRTLAADERLYVKGVEVESHGDYRSGVYMEFARGYGVRDYRILLGSSDANKTRLKTPSEFKGAGLSGEGFPQTMLRQVLFAVYKTGETGDPGVGRDWLRREVKGYWDRRTAIIELLRYLTHAPSPAMTHWAKDQEAAELLAGLIVNDTP